MPSSLAHLRTFTKEVPARLQAMSELYPRAMIWRTRRILAILDSVEESLAPPRCDGVVDVMWCVYMTGF